MIEASKGRKSIHLPTTLEKAYFDAEELLTRRTNTRPCTQIRTSPPWQQVKDTSATLTLLDSDPRCAPISAVEIHGYHNDGAVSWKAIVNPTFQNQISPLFEPARQQLRYYLDIEFPNP